MFWEYLFFISIGSSLILLLFSIFAFIDLEGMKIAEGKHITSGMILLVNSVIYFIIALLVNRKISSNNENNGEKRDQFKSGNLLEMPIIKVN